MASENISNNFILGRMNKSVDERIVPPGEYVDARNVRLGSTESTEIGAVENSKGNLPLTSITFEGSGVEGAKCIGAYEDGIKQTLYWFVTSPTVDMIVSYNTQTNLLTYHVESTSVLNFNSSYLVTGVNKIGDLLFFTDNINPPRVINVTKNYPSPVGGVDQITQDDINVIKKIPGYENTGANYVPLESPKVSLINVVGQENYLIDNFISFAYRYRYEDGQYSALSLFSQPAFQAQNFKFSIDNFNNAGMQNSFNGANVTFSTGTERALEVELVYKDAASNVIYVVERYNKIDNSWANNASVSVQFVNSKIYTTLGSDELLRLYDNVPLLSQAQTIQGNRLMYGNYTEGYNIEQPKGTRLNIDYKTVPVFSDITGTALATPVASSSGVNYTINSSTPTTVSNDQLTFDFSAVSPIPIAIGTTFNFMMSLQSSPSSPIQGNAGPNVDLNYETNGGNIFNVNVQFTASIVYDNVNQMLNSIEFQNSIGTAAAPVFQPVATSTSGATAVDNFNTAVGDAPGLPLINSGITSNCGDPTTSPCDENQGFGYSVNGDSFTLQALAVEFSDAASSPASVSSMWEYFEFVAFSSVAEYRKILNTLSLHSNRDYETGIVYMDDYGRASTVLVSELNTVFIPPINSTTKNQIQVTLNNLPPYWADKYKFVVKPRQGTYETVYVNKVIQDNIDLQTYYYQLEGDNINKVNIGDTLFCKLDTAGAQDTELKLNVLDIKTYARDGINTGAGALAGTNPPGVYMKINSGSINPLDQNQNVFDTGTVASSSTSGSWQQGALVNVGINDGAGVPIPIPAGSTVRIYINNFRPSQSGFLGINSCPFRQYLFDETFTAAQDYSDMYQFMVNQNIDITTGTVTNASLEFENNDGNGPYTAFGNVPAPQAFLGQTFFYQPAGPGTALSFVSDTNMSACGANGNKRSNARVRIVITESSGLVVFETEPAEVDPNLFYDASEFYNISGGFHQSGNSDGDQNQAANNVPLVATLNNGDCFTFGNGVESYKILDELAAPSFQLGERVLAVSNQDYKRAHRFAEVTYSGVFSPGANSNNLNEFNLGLVNFQDYDTSFGPIMKLYARETDILCLQEDRISYILTNKDTISDAGTGGGAIIAVPNVLGKQIARIEEYGISFNPESFAAWGNQMFFTDTKRSAVIMLEGSGQGQSLTNIAESGMRSWFRDQFIEQFETQKLGGYDPYMDEYVMSTNDIDIPAASSITACGVELSQTDAAGAFSYTVQLGASIGDIDIDYTVTSGTITVDALWNGTTTSVTTSESGTLTFNKDETIPSEVFITITSVTDKATYTSLVNCPPVAELTIIQIVLTESSTNGESTHFGYNWSDSNITSPTTSVLANLGLINPSEYTLATGQRSVGVFPYNGTDILMRVNSEFNDTYVFPVPNSNPSPFKYLSSNVEYTQAETNTLIPLLNNVPGPIANPSAGVYQSIINNIDLPIGNQFLYLVWDLRTVSSSTLCVNSTVSEACCGCDIECKTAYFAQGSNSLFFSCNWDTDGANSALRSFNGANNIPTIGDVCYDGASCDPSSVLPSGIYVVDVASPAVANPKTWVKVGNYGLVIDNGTC
tara:strand:+ start:26324 stop:31060 length:4737 start_codon:yes stop_codon:yes gene_type:complete